MSEKDYTHKPVNYTSGADQFFTELSASVSTTPEHTAYKLLSERRIDDLTQVVFDIRAADDGFIYPAGGAYRWKAYHPAGGAKYKWKPEKPEGGYQFYHTPEIVREVLNSPDCIWMASGEADVWALHSAGIPAAFCTLTGEAANLPENLAPWLMELGVMVVYIAPDRDETGLRWARKVRDALSTSCVELVMVELPGEIGSKNDIGAAWQAYTRRGGFERWLLSLPRLDLDAVVNTSILDTTKNQNHAVKKEPPRDYTPGDIPLEYRQLVTHAMGVDWVFASDGFTTKNVPCVFHDDARPSASLNEVKGLYCHVCGQWYTWNTLASELGVISLRDWMQEHGEVRLPRQHGYSLSTETREALISKKLTNTARLLDSIYLAGYRPGDTFTIKQAADVSGMSYATTRRAIIYLQNLPPYLLTAYTRVNSANNSKGRKTKHYKLPHPDDVARALNVNSGWQHRDELPSGALGSARRYRMAVLEALPIRRPGNYARVTLGKKRLGVSISTTRNYVHDKHSRLKVTPQYSKQELRHTDVESLSENRRDVPGNVWLEDEQGNRYAATREGALRAFARSARVWSVEQLANYYSGGESEDTKG